MCLTLQDSMERRGTTASSAAAATADADLDSRDEAYKEKVDEISVLEHQLAADNQKLKDSRDEAIKERDIMMKELGILRGELQQVREDYEHQLKENIRCTDALEETCSSQRHKISVLERELDDANQKLKEILLKENASPLETINKLKRDVAKLETFRTTLMMSLQDEEERLARGPPEYEESSSSIQSHSSNVGISYHDEHVMDASRPRISQSLLLSSQSSTPWITHPETPPTLSASVSPTRTPPPVSPRRHSFSAAPTGDTFDDRPSVYSSANSSPYASMTGRTRVDSKEFFRQVRSRLAYEQFAAFLANVKELNSQKQSKEDTLRKADEILGPDNKDLYAIFERLITRNFS